MTQPTETEADIRAACEEAGIDYKVYADGGYRPDTRRAILALARRIAAEREAVPEARARLEGAEIMREAAAKAIRDVTPTDCGSEGWSDGWIDTRDAVMSLDPAAILAEHTRLTNLIPPDRKIDKHGTVGDSDGDDGA